MSLLWDLYWPVIVAAAVAGVIAGAFGFRRKKRGRFSLAAGIAATLFFAWIWHGPVGTSDRFISTVERQTRQVLVDWEMPSVRAVVARNPVKRTLVLSGPADNFQRGELVRILNYVPGVGSVHWANAAQTFMLPLLVEAELAALISFGIGLLLAYLLELRRRSRAQWSW
jgi:hypothetical protein